MIDQPVIDISEDTPKLFTPTPPKTYGHRQTTPIAEARHIQRVIFSRACREETDPVALAALARGWVALQTAIREMRGIPLPGQLRPDLPPMKGARVKRGKGTTLELAAAAQAFSEAIEREKAKRETPTTPPTPTPEI